MSSALDTVTTTVEVPPPTISVDDAATGPTSTAVRITPPILGGPFDAFRLAVCPKPASGTPDWASCPQVTCLPAQVAACPVDGLAANAPYLVTAVALAGAITSQRSAPDDFATTGWP